MEQPDSDSDTESIPDLSVEKGLRFHLKKKSKLIVNLNSFYKPQLLFKENNEIISSLNKI